jgi:hypothetical protein
VRAGIAGECLVGEHVLPHRLTGNYYRDFFLHDLPKLLEDIPLAIRALMQYMHDGVPAHFSRAVRDNLNNSYHDWWIGTGGLTACPPLSPDLNSLNFYLLGYLNTSSASVGNEEALHRRTVDACHTIRNYPGIFERMRRSMMWCV